MTTTSVESSIERSRQMAVSIDTEPGQHRMLTGDRPTGDLHIGHYLSSLRTRVALQERGVDSFVLIADYQVITDRDSVGQINPGSAVCRQTGLYRCWSGPGFGGARGEGVCPRLRRAVLRSSSQVSAGLAS